MVTVYGARGTAEAMIARVRRMHDMVAGTTSSGEAYCANDPELLNWVHATAVGRENARANCGLVLIRRLRSSATVSTKVRSGCRAIRSSPRPKHRSGLGRRSLAKCRSLAAELQRLRAA